MIATNEDGSWGETSKSKARETARKGEGSGTRRKKKHVPTTFPRLLSGRRSPCVNVQTRVDVTRVTRNKNQVHTDPIRCAFRCSCGISISGTLLRRKFSCTATYHRLCRHEQRGCRYPKNKKIIRKKRNESMRPYARVIEMDYLVRHLVSACVIPQNPKQ